VTNVAWRSLFWLRALQMTDPLPIEYLDYLTEEGTD
jgi:hypothetical protein